ncbi:unnamed protein product [Larinioides sclopetarius]|uniref:Aciniform spidroin n=1 Tax=Larinioides sclopetarius TaxID=280406 RepID=A0AAV2AIW7_9ARAC
MNWLTTLAFAVLLLSVQYDAAQSASPTFSRSPWANPAKASSLMNCLITKIASSNVLPQQEKEDLESIMDTLMSAIKGANAKGKSSGAQLKAINMAVASSLAEIVVAEDVGNQASMSVKTQALSGALEQCFQAVMGTVDRKFISEINDLISMFARQAAEEVQEVQDQGSFNAAGSSATSSFETASQSAAKAYQSSQTFQGSSQTASELGGTYSGDQVAQLGPIGFGPQAPQPIPFGVGSQVSQTQSGLVSKVANALANTSTLRAVLRRGVSQSTVNNIVRRTVQSLANTLGVDGNNLARIALQAVSQVPAGSDTTAYAQALSYSLVTGGILNERNIDSLGSRVLSALLNGVSTAAQGLGINVDLASVQSDIRSSTGFLSTSSSSTSLSQTQASTTGGAASTTGDYTGGYPARLGDGPSGGIRLVSPTLDNLVGGGAQAGLIARVGNALANTSTLRAVLRSGVSQNTVNSVVQRTVQSLANTLGVDGNNLARIALQAVSRVPSGSDTNAYAQALSYSLVTGGILNERNIDSLGSRVLSALLNGVSTAAQGLGINVDLGSVQSDIRSSTGFLSTSSSSTSLSQTAASTTGGAASTTGDYPGGYPAGPGAGPSGGVPLVSPTLDNLVGGGAQAGLIARVGNALANTSTLRAVLRSGVSQSTVNSVVQRTVQSLANTLGVDGNNLARIALQAVSRVPSGSDTNAYAQALSYSLVTGGILNERNIDSLGSRVLSALLNGVSTAAQGLGINVDLGSVQSDIRSSTGFLSTSSSSTSLSQTAASTTGGAASTTGDYSGGYPAGPDAGPSGGVPLVSPTIDNLIGGGAQAGLIARVGNALANTSTLRAVLRSGVSQNTVNSVVQRTVQSLANTLGVDGTNLARIALHAVSRVPAGSDTNAYAQALSYSLVTGGILNERNIDSLGSRVLSALLNGVSTAAQGLGINVNLGSVQSDIRSSTGFLSTGSSSASFSQTATSTTGGAASTTGDYSGGYPAGPSGGVPLVSPTLDNLVGGGAQAGLIARVGNALANTSTLRTVLRSGVSQNTVNSVVQRTVQSLANTLGVDGNNLARIALQAVSQVPAGSDTNAYAQALSYSLVTGGILNERNIDSLGSRVLSALLNGVSTAAQGLGINVDLGSVQSDIRSSTGFLSTSSSSTSFSQTAASTTGGAVSTTGDYPGGYPAGPDAGPSGGVPLVSPTIDNLIGGGAQAGLIARVGNALANTSTLRAVLRSGVSQNTVNSVVQRTVQSLANTLGVDGNNLARIALQAVSRVPAGSDTNAYAQALSYSLVTGGILNERNIDSLGSRVLSALLNGVSTAAQGLGINVNLGSVQSDIRSSTGFLSTGSSSASFSQTATSTTGGAASTTGDYSGGYPAGPSGGVPLVSPTLDNLVGGGAQAGLIARVGNALANTSTLRRVLRSGVSQNTVNSVVQRTVQSLANTLGVDGNNLARIALQAVSQVPAGSDTNAYAQALSYSLVTGGILNERNIDSLGSRVLSALLNGVSTAAQGLGINVDLGSVQSDIRSSTGFLSTSSSSTSFSQTAASTTGGAVSTTGDYPGGYPAGPDAGPSGGVPLVSPTIDNLIGGGAQAGLIARVGNALANTSTLRAVLRSGVSQNTVNSVVQRTVQSLANTLGVDGNNLARIALQAVSRVPSGSDTNAYAQALSYSLVTGGILNERNIDSLGSRVLSALLNGVSTAAQGLGINVDLGSVQSDIRSSTGFLSTSSSSTSFSQTAASTTGGAASTTGDYSGGYPAGPGAGPSGGVPLVSPTLDNLIGGGAQAGLIARVGNALANTSTLRTVLRSGVSQNTVNSVVQRTVQSLANTLGVDGNNLARIALQAVSQVPAGSDTNAYAQALSYSLVTGGILNERNIDSLGSRVLSALLNGVSTAAQGLGINVDLGSVQSDIRSSTGFLSTSSSSTSFSQTAASTTGGAVSTTGDYPGGYPAGPDAGPSGGVPLVSPTLDNLITGGAQAGLIARVGNALANTSTLRTVLRSGVSQNTVNSVVQRTVQSLANTLGVDGNNLARIALQAVSRVPSGSDTNAYAQALSYSLVTGGILNERNIDSLGSRVLSALLNAVSTAAQGLGINVDLGSVQNDIRSSTGFLSTSSSSTSFSQTAASTTGGAVSTTGDYPGGYPAGPDAGPSGGVPLVSPTIDNLIGGGAQAGLIARVGNALANTSTLRTVLRSGVSQNTVNSVVQRTVQSLANTLGVDGTNLARIALQAVSRVPAGSDTNAYAQALSYSLVTGGILNERNIDSLGSRVLSALLNGVSTAAQGLGINVNLGSVQSDIRSSSGFMSTGSSSASFSQTATSTTGGAASTTGDYSGGYPAGPSGGVPLVSPTLDNLVGGGAQAGLIARVGNALANTSTLRTVLRSGVSQNTVNSVVQRTVQSLANTLGVDGNNLARIALQAVSQVPAGSDTNAYAQALSYSLVTGGILNERNIDSLGSRVLSALLNGVSTAAQGLGINVDLGSVQSDIRSSTGFLSTSSSSTSFSQTAASTTGGAASTTGDYPGGYPAGPDAGPSGGVPLVSPTIDNLIGGGAQAGLIARVGNALANTSTLRAVLRSGVSQSTVNSVVQRTVQSLANTLGVDGNNLARIALQAVSRVPSGSDTNAYAQALSYSLVTSGILNERNIDSLLSRVLSALLNGVSTAAQGLGINVDLGSVQSDIRSSTGFLSTSSSSTSLSQTAASTTGGAASTTGDYSGGYPAGPDAGPSGGVPLVSPTLDNLVGGGAQAGLIARVGNALANTSTLRTVLRSGVSQNTVNSVVQRTVQSLANTLGVDGNNLARIALQAVSQVPAGSDTNAYAQALSYSLVTGGILNERNIDSLGSRVLSALLNGVSTAAQGLGINVDLGSVQSDIRSSTGFLSTSSSSTSFSQTAASTTGGAVSTTGDYPGGYPAGPDAGPSGGVPLVSPTIDNLIGGGAQAGLIARVGNALANTSTLRAVLRSGVSQNTVNSVVQRTVQSLANTLGVDGNNLARIALQAVSRVPAGSDTNAYAQALSYSLVTGGILNERNIDSLGSRVLSALLNGVSTAAQGLGINVNLGSVQSDIRSSTGFLSTGSSSASFSQTATSTTGGAASTTGDYSGGYPAGPSGGVPLVSPTLDNLVGGGAQAGLIARVGNALANTSTLRRVLRSGVSQNTVNSVVQRTVQSLANTLGVDGNNLARIALQAVSQVPAGSDTNAYAQALSYSLVTGGILNERNIDSLGSRVLSALLNGVSTAAQGLGINVDLGSVQSDIRSSTGFLSTSSSSTSFSQTAASTTGGAVSTTGDYPGGYPAGPDAGPSGGVPLVSPTIDNLIGGGAQAGLIARVGNALANTSTLRAVLRSGVSQNTVNSVVQRTVQSLANTLGVDGNNLARIALQAVSRVPSGSDTNAYAQALSYSLVTGGILNERNIDSLGSRVLSALLNGVSTAAQGLGINVDLGSVQSDIRSSTGFLSTSSSSTSFSQTAASTTGGAASTTGDYSGGYPAGPGAGPSGGVPLVSPTLDNLIGGGAQAGLIARVGNALANTSTLRTVLRSGVSQNTVNSVVQRTVQSLANTLGVDGNNLARIALQAVSQVPAGSDTNAYAQALSYSLVTGGILNERNIDSLGSRVLSALLNGVSTAAQGLGINVDLGSVQSDIRSSTGFLSTSSSSTSFSQTAASTTGGAVSTTGDYPGGYPAGPDAGPSGGVPLVSPTLDNLITGGAQAGLIARVGNALANTSTLRTVLRSGVSQNTVNSVVQRTVQSLANTLGVDGNNLARIALQAVSRVPSGSDTNAYAQALSYSLVTGGILNERNIDSLGSRVLSALLNAVSTAAQGLSINVDLGSVQNDIRSSTGFLSTSSSSTSFSQTAASTTGGAVSTTGDYPGGYPAGPDAGPSGGVPLVSPTIDNLIGGGAQAGLIARVGNALANTSTLRTVLRSGVSQNTVNSVVQRTVQSLANTLGVDGTNLARIALQAVSRVPAGSDTNAYAQALSYSLVTGGILNERNIDSLGSRVLSALLNGVSTAAQGLGINVNLGSVQSDIRSSTGFMSTGSSSASFSQTATSTTGGAASTTGDYSGGYPAGPSGGVPLVSPTLDNLVGGGAQAGLIARVGNALANTSTLRTVLRSGVSQNTVNSVVQRTVQSLANTLGVDGNNLARIALQAVSQVPAGSDTNAYAQALSYSLVTGGILNERNIDSLGSRVLSALLNGVSTAAQGLGINVDLGSVQSDIRSSTGFLSTSSSSTSFSQTAASTTGGAVLTTGDYPGGYPAGPDAGPSGGVPLVSPTIDNLIGGGAQAGLIARVGNALANTSTLRAVLRSGVSQNTVNSVVQRTVQSLANTLGVDGNNLARIALQAVSRVPSGSDTNAYAQALSYSLVTGGILNERNIDSLGSRVLSALLNGVSTAAQGLGINVDLGSVQSDIRSSTGFLSTSSSSTSFSQTAASTTGGAASTTGDYSGGYIYPAGPDAGPLGGVPLVSPTLGNSVLSTLNSPIGLKSGFAAARINQMTSSLLNAVRPNGIDANALARSLQSSFSSLRSSGMSGSDAKVEVLLETIVGLLQILSNAQIRGVNSATSSSVTSSAARSFELALA